MTATAVAASVLCPRQAQANLLAGEVLPLRISVLLPQAQIDPAPVRPVTTGINLQRSLRLARPFELDPDQPAEPPPAGAPTPTAVSAVQAGATFKPTKMSTMVVYGLQLTFYEHVMRIATQEFTRQQLKGKFWPEYFDSVHVPDQWGDKDHWQVNYIGHAISGGAFARIWMEQREPKGAGRSNYLKGIGRALVYTTLFSIQYEAGPMSEASIGNVGLNPDDLGWSDYVWTPLGGILWTMGEDAIDKYALTWIDKHVPFKMARVAARLIANPSRMLANIGMNRTPWNRSDRNLDGEPVKR